MRFLVPTLLALTVLACTEDTSTPPTDDGPLLHSITESVALPEHAAAATQADTLDDALKALEASPSTGTLSAAQDAWRAARAAFRTLDALQFGPVAELGIDARIDLAPADTQAIDALVNGTATLDASTVANAGGKQKGWLGVEHLLFESSDVESAPARRWLLARLMGDEIAASMHQLNDAWMGGADGFGAELSNAGSSTSKRYPTQRAALNNLVGGVAYGLEVVVGIRLAMPLGRKTNGQPTPSLDPTLASDSAVPDMQASLAGVRALYDAEHGFSEAIKEKSAPLEAQTAQELADCEAKVAAIPRPFGTAVTESTAVVQAAYDACDALKNTWGTDVASALGATFVIDTDGD